jgi:IS5 family transposase
LTFNEPWEEALIEVPTMRRFAGIELISDRIPDETTILTFRHLLEKHKLGEQIFETVKSLRKNRLMRRFFSFRRADHAPFGLVFNESAVQSIRFQAFRIIRAA